MTIQLNEDLMYLTKRRARGDGLKPRERIAINLFWRKGVKVPVLARAFNVSKNTIYYKCLTGLASSYPSGMSNLAEETNDLIERLGAEEAYKKYVTPKMIKAVNDELEREDAERNDAGTAD
jgi:hypothetical protein